MALRSWCARASIRATLAGLPTGSAVGGSASLGEAGPDFRTTASLQVVCRALVVVGVDSVACST
jgi:hypothetical protein